MSRRRRTRATAAALTVAGVAAAAVVSSAVPARAAVFNCFSAGAGWPSGYQTCDVRVTAVDASSYLALHRQPNYTGGVVSGAMHLHDNYTVEITCWAYGSGDADGHGDHYWFWSETSGPDGGGSYVGWINDYYLSTGYDVSAWQKHIKRCPGW